MKHLAVLLVLCVCHVSTVRALEILRWQRIPLSVQLVVGQERVIFVDHNVRVAVPASLGEQLRVQSAGGAVYLRASAPIGAARLQLQDAETGSLILLDVTAKSADVHQSPLEPIRILDGQGESIQGSDHDSLANQRGHRVTDSARATPVAVVLTRYAAQALYAPLRTIEPVNGIAQVPVRDNLSLHTLMPSLPLRATALAAWHLEDEWVTAIKLTNTAKRPVDLDPRTLVGDFLAATFQHPTLGHAGNSTDTTVLYLVTRGHGLAAALLPAISSIDPSANLPSAVNDDGAGHEE